MELKIKKVHEDAVIPKYESAGAAGLDLTATTIDFEAGTAFGVIKVGLGLAIEIPKGFVGLLFPRSSIYKNNTMLSNCVGVLDSDYRGEVMAMFYGSKEDFGYKVGERVIQLVIVPIPQVEIQVVDELSDTNRGSNGWGSTGK